MKYNFTKEVIRQEKSFFQQSWYTSLRIYRLFDADKLIGTFEYRHTGPTFSFNDREYFIQVTEQIFKKSSYKLFDRLTNQLIGEFKLHTWKPTTFRFDNPNPQQKEYFIFERLQSPVFFSIFKRISQGNYKFKLSNGTEAAVYSLKINFTFASYRQNRPSTGEVELSGNNMLLLFAGFFLIERNFHNDDWRAS